MTTLTASPGRRWSRRLPRVDTRLVVGLLLVALSVLGGLRLAASGERDASSVYTAARDLPANHVVGPGDLATTQLHASNAVLDRLVRVQPGAEPTDRVLRFPVAEGDLVAAAALGATTAARP